MVKNSETVKLNMINNKGEEEEKEFTINAHPDKWKFYKEQTDFKASGSFEALVKFSINIFPETVTGIELDNFDGKFPEKLKEFFIEDAQALDILVQDVINFHTPSIKRR